jgi:hypothetical protein
MNGIIKPVLEDDEFGYFVKRADDDAEPGSITSAVINDLINADLVIADLTGFNPNAFYELGIRHALKKPAIHIIAQFVKLPFDNAEQRTIFVDINDYDSVLAAKERLRKALRLVNQKGYQVDNPVTRAGAFLALKESTDPRDQALADIQERLAKVESESASLTRQGSLESLAKGRAIRDLIAAEEERRSIANAFVSAADQVRSTSSYSTSPYREWNQSAGARASADAALASRAASQAAASSPVYAHSAAASQASAAQTTAENRTPAASSVSGAERAATSQTTTSRPSHLSQRDSRSAKVGPASPAKK